MKVKSITNLTFHRNGVDCNSFYSAIVKVTGDLKNEKLLVTFECSKNKDVEIKKESIRVTSILMPNLEAKFRGDDFYEILNPYLKNILVSKGFKSFFDLTLIPS